MPSGDVNAAAETIRHGIEFLEEWPETYEATLQALNELVAEVEQLRERCAQSEHFKEEAEVRAERLRAERDGWKAVTDHADTIRRVELKYRNEVAEAAHRASERDVSTWLAGVSFQEWFDLVAERQQAINDKNAVELERNVAQHERQQAIDDHTELGERLADGLAAMYPTYPEAVAELCDMWLDKSGRLLGEVLEAAVQP